MRGRARGLTGRRPPAPYSVARMVKVGLTGGIGAGKSEVSRLFAARGAVIVDADRISREVVEPGTPGLDAIVAEFGEEVLAPDKRRGVLHLPGRTCASGRRARGGWFPSPVAGW